MNARAKIDMMEATRLIREGRLKEAMAVLRGSLPCAPPSNFEGHAPLGLGGRSPFVLDMLPPSAATGGAWTSPQFGEAPSVERCKGIGRPQLPEALRAFLDRVGKFGSARARRIGRTRGGPGPRTSSRRSAV